MSLAPGELGERVRERGQALALSQAALADCSTLHWSYLGQVERGQTNLTLHNLLKIAAALNVDASELVKGLAAPD